jgi:CheY-like chemotaxis protein
VGQRARVLVLEDEVLFAETLVGLLQDGGYAAAGPARSVAGAMDILAAEQVDAALLDIRLFQEMSYDVAYALKDRAIPFVFVTACRPLQLPRDLRSSPLVEKPFSPPALLQTLRWVLRI